MMISALPYLPTKKELEEEENNIQGKSINF